MPELFLCGPPRLSLDAGTDLALSAREAALLAWLALEGPATRARVAGLLWPRGTDAQARANLRQTLARLRRAAGDIVVDSEGALALAPGVQCRTGTDPGRPLLDGAEPPDADEFGEWLAAQREAMRRQAERDTLARGQAALEAGELDTALACADAALRLAPESEQAWRLRMTAFVRRGDRASALQAWDECRLALRRAFGVAPSPQTEALGRRALEETIEHYAPHALPAQLNRPAAFVGRAGSMDLALQSARLGHAVAVLGPPGIGKSRFISEVVERLGGGLSVSARPGDEARPGALMARLVAGAVQRFAPALQGEVMQDVRRFLPPEAGHEHPPDLTSALDHRRVLSAVGAALQACGERGLHALALDDLQFADEVSLHALHVLAGQWIGAGAPAFAVILGARPSELRPAGSQVLQTLLRSGRAARIELGALEVDDIARLLSALGVPAGIDVRQLAASLRGTLGGVPSYMLESLKLMWLQGWSGWRETGSVAVPPSVRESVRQRLEQLPRDALELAQLAAVAKRDFSGTLAASVLRLGTFELAAPLARLHGAQLFDGQNFTHDVVAEEVLQSLAPPLVQSLHGRIAAELMPLRGAEAGVAFHLDASGDPAAAAPWHRRAAESLRRAWQMEDAARAFEAAGRGFEAAHDPASAFSAWREAARCWIVISRTGQAQAALDQSDAWARTARERFLVRSTRITVLFNAGADARAAADAQWLLEALREDGAQVRPEEAGQALLSAALAAPYMRDPAILLSACAALRERDAQDEKYRARIDFCEAMTLGWMARPVQAKALLERAWASASARRDFGELVNIGNQLVRSAEMRGALREAIAACDMAQSAIERAGAGVGFEADLASHRALLEAASGDDEAARASLHRWLRLRQTVDAASGYEQLRHALTLWLFDRGDEAAGAIERMQATVGAAATPFAAHVHWAALRILAPAPADARPILDRAGACCPHPDGTLARRQAVMQARFGGGEPRDAESLADRLAQDGMLGLARSAASAAAELHALRGDTAAQRHWRQLALSWSPYTDPWCGDPDRVLRASSARPPAN